MNVTSGLLFRFEPEPIPMRNRDIDYVFLGSGTYKFKVGDSFGA